MSTSNLQWLDRTQWQKKPYERERKSQEHTQQALSGHGQLQPEQLAGLSSLYHTSLACSQTSPTLAANKPTQC